jgi:hypothetical protein
MPAPTPVKNAQRHRRSNIEAKKPMVAIAMK